MSINFKEYINFSYIAVICVTLMVLISLLFKYFVTGDKSILILYAGILLCLIICKFMKNHLDFFNKTKINSNEIIKTFFEKTNYWNFQKYISDDIAMWIIPNGLLVILMFTYSFLLLSHASTETSNKLPSILQILKVLLILFSLLHIINLFAIFLKTSDKKEENFIYIMNIMGLYNISLSIIVAIIIAFLYYNFVYTFYRKGLFFQPQTMCYVDNTCSYEPSNTNWEYGIVN